MEKHDKQVLIKWASTGKLEVVAFSRVVKLWEPRIGGGPSEGQYIRGFSFEQLAEDKWVALPLKSNSRSCALAVIMAKGTKERMERKKLIMINARPRSVLSNAINGKSNASVGLISG